MTFREKEIIAKVKFKWWMFCIRKILVWQHRCRTIFKDYKLLVGDKVYRSTFGTLSRETTKRNIKYLYKDGIGTEIISDVKLQNANLDCYLPGLPGSEVCYMG